MALLDSNERRTRFLAQAIECLGLGERVQVLNGRAEDLGRDAAYRGRASVVMARSFGTPPVVAECAAPFLAPGGYLVVSGPPLEDTAAPRWPERELRRLGLEPLLLVSEPFHYQVLRQTSPCPAEYPRRTGVPSKRPLYRV